MPSSHWINLYVILLFSLAPLFAVAQKMWALFEIGDGHAAQGNGEVDITAIETSLVGRLQFIVHKGKTLRWPMAETDVDVTQLADGNVGVHAMLPKAIFSKN